MTFVDDPIPEAPPIEMPLDPFMPSTDIPKPDTPYTYTGEGAQPTWSDVYDGALKEYTNATPTHGDETADPFFRYAQNVGKIALGESIKATSSFINRVQSEMVDNVNLLSDIIGYEFADIANRIATVAHRVNKIAATVTAVVDYVLPLVRAELDKIQHDYPIAIEYGLALERDWVLHHVFAPLYAEILKVQPAINQSAAHTTQVAHDDAKAQVATLAAAVGVVVTSLRAQLSTLQAESDECVKPMCQTMGPNTNLGKLLKGLQLAADAALLADLAGANADDVADVITRVAQHAVGVIGTFERDFLQGGDTLAGLVTRELGQLV